MDAYTQRSEYTENLIRDLRLNTATQPLPPYVVNYELKPSLVAISGTLSNATSAVLLDIGDRDFFVVAANLSYVKDVTATSTTFTITAYQAGAAGGLSSIISLLKSEQTTTTIEKDALTTHIGMPGIRLARNTIINITSDTNVGNFTTKATVFGYFLSK
jgi:hypothetical protein